MKTKEGKVENQLERIPFGITYLDELLTGGIPKGSIIMVAGTPGTGKTTFAIQFSMSFVRKKKHVAYISTITEPFSVIIDFASTYTFFDPDLFARYTSFYDLGEMTKRKGDLEMALNDIVNDILDKEAELIIIDPITVLKEYTHTSDYRKILDGFLSKLRITKATIIITGEIDETEITKAPESYLVDGILVFSLSKKGLLRQRLLNILKMRGTKHTLDAKVYDICVDGLKVFEIAEF